MKILATHPGKIGDFLWALPTVRALAETFGEKVTLLVPPGLAGVGELVKLQPYVEDVVVDKWWEVQETAPVTPMVPPSSPEEDWDVVFHLGYREWPRARLAEFVYQEVREAMEGVRKMLELDLGRAWIEAPTMEQAGCLGGLPSGTGVVGFTDEWAELKAGIIFSLYGPFSRGSWGILCPPGGSRLSREWAWEDEAMFDLLEADWVKTAYYISRAKCFLGCLSSMAVLAAAMGKPRVLVEPNPHRHHEIFQHWDTPLVLGTDGLPTFDARHVADALAEKLR